MTPEQELLFGIDKLNVVRSVVPAVTHVDYSARIQTVHRDTNPKYHALITKICMNWINILYWFWLFVGNLRNPKLLICKE